MTASNIAYPALTHTEHDPLRVLAYFFILADGHSHGAARAAAGVLLSFYNGYRFQFDLTDLRVLDERHLQMALVLMKFDALIRREVHEHLNLMYGRTDFGMRFEHIAHKWRMKGKCKRDHLNPVERIALADPFKD
ncbi:hypothetical protein N5C67_10385 [Comamonas thiooxydans]|uniref:DUF7673 family protein n=1 Tax=Comamonas thiooxydans TaxID=363952 RepID=UPI00244930E8|nr:hypothetical protein [Comamonas thiooxydans]MDH1253060.1 hypothetical protein [Comamonas thiooxydans]